MADACVERLKEYAAARADWYAARGRELAARLLTARDNGPRDYEPFTDYWFLKGLCLAHEGVERAAGGWAGSAEARRHLLEEAAEAEAEAGRCRAVGDDEGNPGEERFAATEGYFVARGRALGCRCLMVRLTALAGSPN